MKHLMFCLLAFVFAASVQAQHHCNHKISFSRSAVADTIDAIHYKIHLQAIDFENQSIQAETQLKIRPKLSLNRIPLELKALEVESVSSNDITINNFEQNGDLLHINLAETLTETDTEQSQLLMEAVLSMKPGVVFTSAAIMLLILV